jgi:hypothetical protein
MDFFKMLLSLAQEIIQQHIPVLLMDFLRNAFRVSTGDATAAHPSASNGFLENAFRVSTGDATATHPSASDEHVINLEALLKSLNWYSLTYSPIGFYYKPNSI